MEKLTVKQELFVLEYLKDFNATQAAIRAGYSEHAARAIGYENLTKPYIQEAIQAAQQERFERTKIDVDWVLTRLVEEATADIADLYEDDGSLRSIKEWPLIWRQGLVSGLDVTTLKEEDKSLGIISKLKLSDRIKRIELIGKHVDIQAFATKIEASGPGGGPIEIEDVTDIDVARRLAFLLTQGAEHATEH